MNLSSLLFGPSLCGGCGRVDTMFCSNCWKNICWYDHRVADPAWTYPSLSAIQAATEYYPPIDKLIHHVKYDFWWAYIPILAQLIDYRLGSWALKRNIDFLVPVPLHHTRRAWRGFNQAELLCQELTKLWGIPTASILKRTQFQHHQASLNKSERHRLQYQFVVKPDVDQKDNKRFLLIDDVMTTGATLSGCARALEKLTPSWIGAACIARA